MIKKGTSKVISLAMGLSMFCGTAFSMVGCGRSDYGENINKDQTQLIISNYDGGFGSQWLYDLEEKFEAAYANVSYEEGKTGVQILVDPNKTEGDFFDFAKTSAHIAFTEKMSTEYLISMATTGKLMDLSDVLDSILAQDGVSLDENIISALKVVDGTSVYNIPHYEGGGGIVYDKDIFDEYNLYRSSTGGWTNASGQLSVGPDGKEGTLDDGLPATYEEFFQMCVRMKQNSITPFILSGEWKTSYCDLLLTRAATAYDGVETTEAFLNYDGSNASYVESITDDASAYFGYSVTKATADITAENGYLKEQTAGRLYALELLNEIISENYYDVAGWAGTVSHLDAQDMYLKSVKNNEPIAMLIDGTWWENEANSVFESMGSVNANYKKENRNFGWMPLPTKVDANDTNTSVDSMATVDHLNACAIARSGLSEGMQRLVKDFLKFCYTPENLEAFTLQTGTTRAFKYKISEETYNKLTPYQQDIWTLHENGAFIYKNSVSQFYAKNYSKVFSEPWVSEEYRNVVTTFSTKGNTVTARQFYESFWMTKKDWDDTVTK